MTTILLLVVALLGTSARAATRTWDGGGADANWNTINNWDGNVSIPATTDDVVFGTGFGSGTTISLNTSRTANSLTIDSSTGFTIAGTTLTLTAGTLTRNSTASGDQIISSAVSIGANAVWDIQGSGTLTVSGAIGETVGTFNLTKNGSGTLVLSANNALDGILTLNAGTLRATTDGDALGNNGATLTLAGGNLQLANNTALAYGNNTIVSGNTTITSDRLANGAGVNHTLGTLSIGAQTLTVNAGSFVTSGTASITFGAVTLTTPGGAVFDVASGASLTLDTVSGATFNFTVQGAGDTTINGNITTTSGTLTKNGTGTLTLSGGNNAYTGLTTINGGVVNIDDVTSLGTTAGDTILNAGALGLTGNITVAAGEDLTLNGTGISGGGALRNVSGNNTWAGLITLGSASRINSDSGLLTITGVTDGAGFGLTVGGAGNTTFSTGGITDSAGATALTKDGIGTLTLTAANTYSGATIVDGGTVVLSGVNGAIASSSSVTINNGATAQISNTSTANNANRIGTVSIDLNGGTFDFANTGGAANYSETVGALNLSSGDSIVSSSRAAASQTSTLTFSSGLGRSAGATVNFTGTSLGADARNHIVLTGQGTGFIDQGTFINGANYAYYDAGGFVRTPVYGTDAGFTTAGPGATFGAGGSHKQITGDITTQTTASIDTLRISAGGVDLTLAAAQTVTFSSGGILKAGGGGSSTISGGTGITTGGSTELVVRADVSGDTLIISTPILSSSTGGLTKSGAGTLQLNAANGFTGGVTVNAGVLQLGSAGALNSNAVNVNAPGTLRLNGNSVTVAGLTGAGTVENNNAAAATLTVNKTSGSDTFSGVLQNGAAGTLALTKTGAGTLVLNKASTYTAGTTLGTGAAGTGGAVTLGANGAMGSGGLTFAGGILNTANFNHTTTGALSLTADSTLNLGAGGALADLNFGSATWTSGVLTINNWTQDTPGGTGTDDQIFITTAPDTAFLNHVHFQIGSELFFGVMNGTELVAGITAVPEPINVALGVFGVVFAGFGFARRLRKRNAETLKSCPVK